MQQQKIRIPEAKFQEIAGKYMSIIANPQASREAQNNAMIGLSEFQNSYTYK